MTTFLKPCIPLLLACALVGCGSSEPAKTDTPGNTPGPNAAPPGPANPKKPGAGTLPPPPPPPPLPKS